ncbi:helix-loop-helix domain-containing protein [Thalassotalea sp. G20_0]|uniref:basic helix-loop-helix domain-containing protein n=1 Tax=Thalassotalea sp. G20_0 TaxID=2821093 RepID=UPI001ADD47C0|nr:helix-loop-helix domain-containing protein [Thalassotalea sp. G20_0]MBO9494338.1 helix-loop-helix domain-containing protein [Thalassotalea sp. G20_0]
MNFNITPMQSRTPSDNPYGMCRINSPTACTFNQFNVQQIDPKFQYSIPATEESTNPPQRSYDERKKIRADNEKRRRETMKQAYQALRNEIPGASNQQLTKVETLIQATAYIQQLEQQLGISPDFT